MKIVYIADSVFPSQTANSIHVMKMCNAMVELGHDIELIGFKGINEECTDIFDYYGVSNKISLNLISGNKIRFINQIFNGLEFRKTVKNLKPDLFIGRSLSGFYFCSNLGIPYIFESHEPILNQEYKLNGKIFKKIMLLKILNNKNIKSFVLISEELKKLYDFSKFSNLNVIVAHDGADICDLDEKVVLLGKPDSLKIGYIGKFFKGRGLDIILKIAKNLQNFEFHLLGGTIEELNKLFPDIEVPKNIFTYNFLPPSEVFKYRNAMDILLAPYQNEQNISAGINTTSYMSPLKIFEYLSSGKAIVASDFPVLREVLNKDNSIIVSYNNLQDWENALVSLKSETFRNKLSQNALLDFKNNYSWKTRAFKLLNGSELLKRNIR